MREKGAERGLGFFFFLERGVVVKGAGNGRAAAAAVAPGRTLMEDGVGVGVTHTHCSTLREGQLEKLGP